MRRNTLHASLRVAINPRTFKILQHETRNASSGISLASLDSAIEHVVSAARLVVAQ
jgi:hypothetical protein